MLTLLEFRLERLRQRIQQKLPQAPELVLEKVWTILNATNEDDYLLNLIDGKLLAMKMKRKSKQC
jgi:hypothetical protein